MPSEHELRCFCRKAPLLGRYGVDDKRRLFVHVKIYKQGRIFGEVIHQSGVVRIKCRECLRWHKITIRDTPKAAAPEFVPEELPDSLHIG